MKIKLLLKIAKIFNSNFTTILLTFCPNDKAFHDSNEIKDTNFLTKEKVDILIEEKLKETKLEIIPKLIKFGLTTEQIAHALDLDLVSVLNTLKELLKVNRLKY